MDGGATAISNVSLYVTNTLVPSLELVPGVANITLDGAPTRQFQVLLDPNKLKYFNIIPSQVVSSITNQAINTPIGTIVNKDSSLTFSTQNTPADITAVEHIMVDATRGIQVDDIGSVRDVPQPTNYARVNGKPVVLVSIQRTTDSNSIAVVDAVRASLKSTILPPGYSVVFGNGTDRPDSGFRGVHIP